MRGLLSLSGAFAAAMLFAGSALARCPECGGEGRGPDRKGPPPWANAGGQEDGKPGRPEFEKPPLSEVDTDGDGKVSDAEREAFREKMREKVMAEARKRVLENFDENGDGAISGEELDKLARVLFALRKHDGRPGPGPRPEGIGDNRQGPPPWSNAGGNQGDGRQGPPPWSNAGGKHGDKRQGPPPWANADGPGHDKAPLEE